MEKISLRRLERAMSPKEMKNVLGGSGEDDCPDHTCMNGDECANGNGQCKYIGGARCTCELYWSA